VTRSRVNGGRYPHAHPGNPMTPERFRPPPLGQLLAGRPYGPRFATRLRDIHPDLPARITEADALGVAVVDDVMRCALSFACQSQHVSNVQLGRAALLALPRAPVLERIVDTARATLDLRDEWDVRRFLEVLCVLDRRLLRSFAVEQLASPNPEIREAAEDLLEDADAG